jgi:steroid delta-isomerase-like uncharacterized protein
MAEQDNVSIARGFFEGWNERDFDRPAALVAEDGEIFEVATGERFRGPEGARHEYEKWATSLPDGKVEINNVIAAGNWAVVESTLRGTNTGPFASPAGEIPATGRALEFDFCTVMEIRDGKVVRGRHYHDVATMMRQLGLLADVPVGATA